MWLSIVIPTFNRASLLGPTLISVAEGITGAADVEVLLVDNGSTDKTALVCKEIAQRYPRVSWRYFHEPMPGLLSGRHRGCKESRGEILSYLDDDVLLARSWLEGVRDAFRDASVALVGGPSLPRYEVKPPSWLAGLWLEPDGGRSCSSLSLIDLGQTKKPVHPELVWGLNFSIRRGALVDCGGFHPDTLPRLLQRYQGDGETGLSLKIEERGLGSLYHPEVAVEHVIPASRLTPLACELRGFFQGVCNSYTQIRRDRAVAPSSQRSWKDSLRRSKWALQRAMLLRRADVQAIRTLIAHSLSMGVKFHQNEVRNDPDLLDWVLRPDYLNYDLPPGWKKFYRGCAAA